jgi:hypothetical protein
METDAPRHCVIRNNRNKRQTDTPAAGHLPYRMYRSSNHEACYRGACRFLVYLDSGTLDRFPHIILRWREVASRCSDAAVAEGALDFGEVGAALQHPACEAVAKRVGRGLAEFARQLHELAGLVER